MNRRGLLGEADTRSRPQGRGASFVNAECPVSAIAFVWLDGGLCRQTLDNRESEFMDDIEALLERLHAGDHRAQDDLFAAAYCELRKLARSRLYKHGRVSSLDTTALVHETYLRLQASGQLRAEQRGAFFLYASRVMRSVIIDAVREHQAQRRGGDLERLTLNTQLGQVLGSGSEEALLQLHAALELLGQAEPRLAQVVEMRYFGGYTEAEIALAQCVNERTVRRDWRKAIVLLQALMRD